MNRFTPKQPVNPDLRRDRGSRTVLLIARFEKSGNPEPTPPNNESEGTSGVLVPVDTFSTVRTTYVCMNTTNKVFNLP